MVQKHEDCSKSVSSIDSGAIFLSRLGQDLSRNAFVVSILFPGEKLYVWIGFSMTPTMSGISEKVLSASVLLNLGGPAGGSAPGKVLRPQEGIPYDS